MTLFPAKPVQVAARKVIDVSGDGSNNRGRAATTARDEAVAAGITINGLPITALEPDLDRYYRDNVIGGPGAFVIAAESYETFADAILRKLIVEIARHAANVSPISRGEVPGSRRFPGLTIVYLASARRSGRGDALEEHPRASDRRTAGLGARHGAARRRQIQRKRGVTHLGRNRRHGLLGDARRTRSRRTATAPTATTTNTSTTARTFRKVIKDNTIGVEFVGNYPDVAKPPTPAQTPGLGRSRARSCRSATAFPPSNIYAHNWIDFKDARYCEGCELATAARELAYVPGRQSRK